MPRRLKNWRLVISPMDLKAGLEYFHRVNIEGQMLEQLRSQAGTLQTSVTGQFPSQAAVLIALTDQSDDPEIIFTRRARHLSAHSGEVSFPGGKWDSSDCSLLDTALRESKEEIDLDPAVVDVQGAMPSRLTRWDVKVTPYVGIIPRDIVLTPNLGELDSIFRVPLSYFLSDQRARTDMFNRGDQQYWAPAYMYQGYEIWGFTAGLLVEFLNRIYGAGIGRQSSAPVRNYS